MNYTKQQLTDMIRRMGIQPDDSIMVHASMKSIGNVDGGADTVLDAWMEYLSDGLFMMPTHTWAQMGPDCRIFDPQNMSSCVGLLTNLFRIRPGVVRSLHPTHSIAAYGKKAKEYIAGEETVDTPCSPEGCWGRLENIGAKILLIGVGHERNTFIHAVEESMNVPERLTDEPSEFFIRQADDSLLRRPVYRHYNKNEPHISEHYPKLAPALEACGAARHVSFGDADCILCDARQTASVTRRILSHEKTCLLERDVIPQKWWQED